MLVMPNHYVCKLHSIFAVRSKAAEEEKQKNKKRKRKTNTKRNNRNKKKKKRQMKVTRKKRNEQYKEQWKREIYGIYSTQHNGRAAREWRHKIKILKIQNFVTLWWIFFKPSLIFFSHFFLLLLLKAYLISEWALFLKTPTEVNTTIYRWKAK